ncbi:uncharacterized protein LOC112198815 [Rosa chinensis]|uniref:uncharacterized protein LOC112198815 n=1 Tax=Rosa chinensis TaxID=74649 RepID=UPI000D08F5A0|nr:uncharacterized protein LOC112198815 [Rosa chinensis]
MQNPFGGPRANACPWGLSQSVREASAPKPPLEVRTFASIVSDSVESSINLNQLTAPVVRGDKIYVKINERIYQEQLKSFRTNLIGRLLLKKGSVPLKTIELKAALDSLWKPSGSWRLVPLGKGYFDIHFSTEEDMRRIWGGGTCTLASGIFRLSEWKPDFKPGDVMPQTHAQVWIQISGLSQDYWHPHLLMEIARGVGTPLQLDRATKERQFGYYARVLVDVDLATDLPSSIMVERENFCFPVEIWYENLPDKCSNCGVIGHSVGRCRHLQKQEPKTRSQHDKNNQKVVRQEYRAVSRSSNEEVKRNVVTSDIRHDMQMVYASPPNMTNEIVTKDQHAASTLTVHDDSPRVQSSERELVEIAQFAQTVIEEAALDEMETIAQRVIEEPLEANIEVANARKDDLSSSETTEQVLEEHFSLENAVGELTKGKTSGHDLPEEAQCTTGIDGTPPRGQFEMQAVNSMMGGDTGLRNMTLVLSKGQKKRLRKQQREEKQPGEGTVDCYPARNRGPPHKLNL